MRHGHRVADTDTHQMEPPDLWLEWIEAPFRDAAPRRQEIGGRMVMAVEGESLTSEGRYPFSTPDFLAALMNGMQRFERLRAARFDAKARLLDTDEAGVDVQILYPTVGGLFETQPIPEASKRRILWDNAARAFGLEA